MGKKFISIMLIMLMALSTFGTFVFAEESGSADVQDAVITEDQAAPAVPAAEPEAAVEETSAEAPEAPEAEGDTVTVTVTSEYISDANAVRVKWDAKTVTDGTESEVAITNSKIEVTKDGVADDSLTMAFNDASREYIYTDLPKGVYKFKVTVNASAENPGASGESAELSVPGKDDGITHTVAVSAERISETADVKVAWTLDGVRSTETPTIEVFRDGAADTSVTTPEPDAEGVYLYSELPKGVYKFKVTVNGSFGESAEVTVPAWSKIKFNLETYSAYKSVVLEWDKPEVDPDYYEIWSDGELLEQYTEFKSPFDDSTKYYYQAKNAADEKFHTYFVKAVFGTDENTVILKSDEKKDQMLKQMYISLTFKENKELIPHGGKKKKHKFKVGDTVLATGYVKGQYHFYYKGTLHFVNYNRVTKQKALYNGRNKWNYSPREAQWFINTSKQTSMTDRLIFVNLYTQHIYMLAGKKNTKGKWVADDSKLAKKKYKKYFKKYKQIKAYDYDWEVSSGTAVTPSPWGLGLTYKKKPVNIYTRERTVNGHTTRFWNFYHSETALHGRADNRGYGKPFSHGCIRNPDERAIYILHEIPLKTRVVIY